MGDTKELRDAYKQSGGLHHAYLMRGERSECVDQLKKFFEQYLGFKTRGNPDFWHGEFQTFGIDDGREIARLQSMRPVCNNKKIFIIAADFFTVEAQNSLLKIFEEPAPNTHFFVVTKNTDTLLPTLKSRFFELGIRRKTFAADSFTVFAVDDFLTALPSVRIGMVKKIIDTRDKMAAIRFFDALEEALHNAWKSNSERALIAAFEHLYTFKKYLNTRSPSVRVLLEGIALLLPVLSDNRLLKKDMRE